MRRIREVDLVSAAPHSEERGELLVFLFTGTPAWGLSVREPDILVCNRRLFDLVVAQEGQLGFLHALVEVTLPREAMQQRGESPREFRRRSDAFQRRLRISIQHVTRAVLVMFN